MVFRSVPSRCEAYEALPLSVPELIPVLAVVKGWPLLNPLAVVKFMPVFQPCALKAGSNI